MGCVIGRIHMALRSYSVLDSFLPSIIIIVQHYSQALNTYMFVGYPAEACLTCCESYWWPFIFVIIYGVVCVQLAHFRSRWLKGYIYSSCYYHHQIGSIQLSHCYPIFPWSCAWDVCYIIFCHLLHIRSGKTGNLFSLLLCSLWWVQIFRYVLACRSYSFVCTVHHLIIIIVQSYLKALNL